MSFNIFQNTIIVITALLMLLCFVHTVIFWRKLWQECKEKTDILFMVLTFGILLLIGYGCMMASDHYSVDSFNLIFDMGPYWHMQNGRYINCGVILLAQLTGMNQVVLQRIFIAIWIITLMQMMMMITVSVAKCLPNLNQKKYFLLMFIVSLSFLNVFAMELMLFPEMAMVFIPGNLALGLAIYVVLGDLIAWKKWLFCIFYLLIALGSYQSYIGIFESFVLIGLFFKWKDNIKKRYMESIVALFLGGCMTMFNVVFSKILINASLIGDPGRGATFDINQIISNVKGVLKYQIAFWKDADGIMIQGIMPALGLVMALILVKTVRRMETIEKRVYLVVIVFGCYVLAFAPHIVESYQILSPRSNIAVWSVIALVFIAGLNNTGCLLKSYDSIIVVMVGILIGANCFVMQDMAANEQAMNAIDIMEAEQICNRIEKYENETGMTVSKVAAVGDINSNCYQETSRYKNCELGARIMTTYYSNYRLIGHILNRNMVRCDMPDDVYQEYFIGKDWNCLNVDEQVVLIGDTLYLAVY